MTARIEVSAELLERTGISPVLDAIGEICARWKIVELELFGSVLRDDFGPDSDVDMMVTFVSDAPWDLLDLVRIENELTAVLGRNVDLTTRRAVESSGNPFRQEEILGSARTLYAA